MQEGYVAEYLRISDDDEDLGEGKEESNSIANQRKVLDTFLSGNEELSQYPKMEFVDDGVSGVNFERPGVQRLLAEVKKSRIVCIVVKDLSRFGRNYIEVGDYIEQIFPFLGVRFISVSDHFDSAKASAGLDVGFKNLVHDLYSRDLSKKIKSVKALHQKQGNYSGGGVPYGYRRNEGEGACFVPDEDAAKVVREIFRLAAEGNTTSKIADRLNQEEVPVPGAYKNQNAGGHYQMKNEKRHLWSVAQVGLIIQNEVYLGTYIGHKLSTVRPREVKQNDRNEFVKIEEHHERLVEREIFEKAQKIFVVRNREKHYKKTEKPCALRGKVKCGFCGYGMSLKQLKKRSYFYCRMGESCGSHLQIDRGTLENVVQGILRKLADVYREQEAVKLEEGRKALAVISEAKKEKKILELKASRCKAERLELYHKWKEGKITKEEYIRQKDEAVHQEGKWRGELEELKEKLEGAVLAQGIQGGEDDISVLMGDLELTRELVEALIERIEVYGGDRVEIKWKFQSLEKDSGR